jgi:hypothetical protein
MVATHAGVLEGVLVVVVYIESTDFRLQYNKDYHGLAPGKRAMFGGGSAAAAAAAAAARVHGTRACAGEGRELFARCC